MSLNNCPNRQKNEIKILIDNTNNEHDKGIIKCRFGIKLESTFRCDN